MGISRKPTYSVHLQNYIAGDEEKLAMSRKTRFEISAPGRVPMVLGVSHFLCGGAVYLVITVGLFTGQHDVLVAIRFNAPSCGHRPRID